MAEQRGKRPKPGLSRQLSSSNPSLDQIVPLRQKKAGRDALLPWQRDSFIDTNDSSFWQEDLAVGSRAGALDGFNPAALMARGSVPFRSPGVRLEDHDAGESSDNPVVATKEDPYFDHVNDYSDIIFDGATVAPRSSAAADLVQSQSKVLFTKRGQSAPFLSPSDARGTEKAGKKKKGGKWWRKLKHQRSLSDPGVDVSKLRPSASSSAASPVDVATKLPAGSNFSKQEKKTNKKRWFFSKRQRSFSDPEPVLAKPTSKFLPPSAVRDLQARAPPVAPPIVLPTVTQLQTVSSVTPANPKEQNIELNLALPVPPPPAEPIIPKAVQTRPLPRRPDELQARPLPDLPVAKPPAGFGRRASELTRMNAVTDESEYQHLDHNPSSSSDSNYFNTAEAPQISPPVKVAPPGYEYSALTFGSSPQEDKPKEVADLPFEPGTPDSPKYHTLSSLADHQAPTDVNNVNAPTGPLLPGVVPEEAEGEYTAVTPTSSRKAMGLAGTIVEDNRHSTHVEVRLRPATPAEDEPEVKPKPYHLLTTAGSEPEPHQNFSFSFGSQVSVFKYGDPNLILLSEPTIICTGG